MTDTTPLHWWTARDLAAAIRRRELSAREVVAWHLDRIAAVNPRVNAIVSLRPEEALAEAEAADRRAARAGAEVGPLHGLPIAIKDLVDTAGIRTTYGSAAFADHVPAADDLLVRRLRAAGAIVVGKTNTPEFGVGSHTFNAVFGTTRNPWALDRSAGGSSGGAGAALAAGDAADRRRLRPRREHPQPVVVQQRRRPAPHGRARADRRRRRPVGRRGGGRADGAHRRRPRPDAHGDHGARSALAALPRRPGGVRDRAARRPARAAGGVVPGPRRPADRAGCAGGARRGARPPDRRGRRGRGRRARPARGRPRLRDPPRARLRATSSPTARPSCATW